MYFFFFKRMGEGHGAENSNNPLECKFVFLKEAHVGSCPVSVGLQGSHTNPAAFRDGVMVPGRVWVKNIETAQLPGEQDDAWALTQHQGQAGG